MIQGHTQRAVARGKKLEKKKAFREREEEKERGRRMRYLIRNRRDRRRRRESVLRSSTATKLGRQAKDERKSIDELETRGGKKIKRGDDRSLLSLVCPFTFWPRIKIRTNTIFMSQPCIRSPTTPPNYPSQHIHLTSTVNTTDPTDGCYLSSLKTDFPESIWRTNYYLKYFYY